MNDRRGAVFLDRDGVLNEDSGYVHRIEDYRWIEGAREAVARINQAGLYTVVVTNQSGVARRPQGRALHRRVAGGVRGEGAGDEAP
jgi:D-glycero-D-manno-heptose 1,7-bisphosphate phosphatase